MKVRIFLFRCYICICYICMLLVCPAVPVAADSITVSAQEKWPPFSDSELPNGGYIADIVTEAFGKSGYTVEYEFYPWKRALEMAKRGKVDALLGAYYRKDRERHFKYADPLCEVRTSLFAQKGRNLPVSDFKDIGALSPFEIGVIIGSAAETEFEKAGLILQPIPSQLGNIKKLLAGRVDLIVGLAEWVQYLLNTEFSRTERERIIRLDPPLSIENVHIVFSRKRKNFKKLAEILNRGLKMIEQDGTLAAIEKRHYITR